MTLRDFLGLGSESETSRDGPLSSYREWHSLLIGLGVGFVAALNSPKDSAWLLLLLVGFAYGARKVDVGALRHIRKEPQYALTAALISFLITAFVIVPRLPSGLF
jgi:hypothetical protein